MKYKLSKDAESDIENIIDYTFVSFGERQAIEYYKSLESSLNLLSDNPFMGRKINHIKEGYFCHLHNSHYIFYTKKTYGILIARVLHKSMDSANIL